MKLKTTKLLSLIFFIAFTAISCNSGKQKVTGSLQVIPLPNNINLQNDSLDISSGFTLVSQSVSEESENNLKNYLSTTSLPLSSNGVNLQLQIIENKDSVLSDEGYKLNVNKKGVAIYATTETGLFYGLQTVIQLSHNQTKIPFLEITDNPRFAYRGLHIDVSRHFFPIDFLKKQIDIMAQLKFNRFHWHFTDGPGWRIEIKKYPELTNIAAWRTHPLWKDWWESGRKYVSAETAGAYGGFYTQEEARELVRYAAERHIVIIPEIEMPGHSEEVLAMYPQLSCTEKPYTSSEFCIGNDETFEFLENVLTEIIDIFPSEYIHIGGDEAEQKHWKECVKCQARIKEEGLKNESELQSYLIRRIEKFLHSKDRKLIGWDEILDGGLDKSAVVMAWRNVNIGIDAVQNGYKVIMTPAEFCYLDSYQGIPDTQPEAIGGFLPIEKVYSFNPAPDSLSENVAKQIWGVQANAWAEYIPTEQHMEYMLYPRALAMAEVAWTQPEKKSWDDFKSRVNYAIPILQSKGYNPYTLSKEPFIALENDSVNKAIEVTLTSELTPIEIRYTTDGNEPSAQSPLYSEPLMIRDSAMVKAKLFRNGEAVGNSINHRIDYHHGIGKKVIYNTPYSKYYPASGETTLIDGIPGGLSHGDGLWQGFMLPEIDIVIDLQEVIPIKSINVRFLQNANSWIWFPKTIVYSVSEDGETYNEVNNISGDFAEKDEKGTLFHSFAWSGAENARFVRLHAVSNGIKGGWMFLDEITVW